MNDTRSLLAVFAHPDDETFAAGAMLAHCAEQGVRVTVLCATRGEAGKITDPNLTIDDLGRHREAELREACTLLGIEPPLFAGYRDSGRLERLRRDDPKATINIDYLEFEEKIMDAIRETKPQVLLTHDPHGGYGHPDHLTTHRAATAAFFSSGHLPQSPSRLFYTGIPIKTVQTWIEMPNGPITPGMTAEVYGLSPETIALRFDGLAQIEKKRAALRAHGSQTGPNSRMGSLPPEMREQLEARFRFEHFALGGTRGPVPHWPLHGFFDGLA